MVTFTKIDLFSVEYLVFSATAKKQPGSYPGPDPVQKPEKEKEKDKENKPVKQEKIEKEEEPDKSDVSVRKRLYFYSSNSQMEIHESYSCMSESCAADKINSVRTQMTGHHGWNSGEL